MKYTLLLALLIILSTSTGSGVAITPLFANGTGTSSDPYQIATVDHLQNMKLYMSAHYVLIDDINASSTSSWNGNAGFEPIGSSSNNFIGSLEGQGYEITGLYINRLSELNVGLFGYVSSSCKIENVSLINYNVTGFCFVGGLVGINDGTLSSCYATGNVTGSSYVGGLVGGNVGTLSSCYATGNVTGSVFVGGLVGDNVGTLSSCYATGNVTGSSSYVGGLVGINDGTLSSCYATGNVTGSSLVGGLVGDNVGALSSCYWDKETTGQDLSAGLSSTYGKNTDEMKNQSTYFDWNFTDVWAFCDEATTS